MAALALTVLSQSATKIVLSWTPVPCVGYVFFADGKRVSNTWDPLRSQVSFAKGPSVFRVDALGVSESGSYPPPVVVPPPPAGIVKPTYAVKLTPGYYASQDGPAANYQACWLGAQNGTYSIDRRASDTFSGALMFKPGASWPTGPTLQGEWGRMWNFHNTSLEGGYGWSIAPGNSAFAIDFIDGNLLLNLDANGGVGPKNYLLKMLVPLGHRYTIALDVVWGRTDGSTARPGSAKVWIDGALVLDTGPANTMWKWSNGATQYSMWVWAGFYTRGLHDGRTLDFEMAFPFMGRTRAEALANTVGGEGGAWALANLPIAGRDHTLGPATCAAVPSWSSSDLVLPAGWS